MNESPSLTHLREDGSAAMVDISGKPIVGREAVAESFISLESSTLNTITNGQIPKGDVLAVARIAGIQAAKKTAELIPLCHQLSLTKSPWISMLKALGFASQPPQKQMPKQALKWKLSLRSQSLP